MSLLPPVSTKLERAFAAMSERLSAIDTPARQLWNPDTCPEPLLPWLAWALGVDVWKSYWPENVKRSLLRSAVSTKRRTGTAASVRAIVAAFGAAVSVREAWELNPPGAPHTFAITVTAGSMGGQPITEEFQEDIIAEVGRTKPVRSSFTVTAGLYATASVGVCAVARAAIYHRLELTES